MDAIALTMFGIGCVAVGVQVTALIVQACCGESDENETTIQNDSLGYYVEFKGEQYRLVEVSEYFKWKGEK